MIVIRTYSFNTHICCILYTRIIIIFIVIIIIMITFTILLIVVVITIVSLISCLCLYLSYILPLLYDICYLHDVHVL
jgi:hypothetical protein